MKIAFIAEFIDFGVGGVNAQVYRLCHALKRKGIEVTMNCGLKDADIIHAHTPFHRAIASTLTDVPKVATIHSIPEGPAYYLPHMFQPLFKNIGWSYYRKIYDAFDRKLAPTEYVKRKLESHGISVDKVRSNGVDLSVFRKSRGKEKQFRELYAIEGNYVLSVGDIRPAKNTHAIDAIAKKLPELTFVHIGTHNALAPSFYSKKVFSHAPPNLRFLGRTNLDHLIGGYSGALAFLHPSHIETEGLVVLEALACQTPTIVKDIPAYDGFLKHGKNAFVCNSIKNFVNVVGEVSCNNRMRRKLSQNGYLAAKERSFSKTVKEHIRLYDGLTSKKR